MNYATPIRYSQNKRVPEEGYSPYITPALDNYIKHAHAQY